MTTTADTSSSSIRREPGLLGQTVVVIGGSSGIGLETARQAIDHQRLIVASQQALRLNTQASQDLLTVMERSQEIFEGNLAGLLREREREQSA